MNHFFIITNEEKDRGFVTTRRIRDFLHKKGKTCCLQQELINQENDNFYEGEIPSKTECVIVLGGDGTLLRAARNLMNYNIPLLGINLGHLGYLTEGDRNSASSILERVIADEYVMEERMMLKGKVRRKDGTIVCEDVALNDICVNRSGALRIIKFKLYVNGKFLYLYSGDGMIISTPTGSTAYNLSCGGPVVEPTAELFVVTPIAPHSLNNRSLILSSHDKIEIELLGSDKTQEAKQEYAVAFDDLTVPIYPGDRVEIEKAPQVARILKLSTGSFLETLRIKMS